MVAALGATARARGWRVAASAFTEAWSQGPLRLDLAVTVQCGDESMGRPARLDAVDWPGVVRVGVASGRAREAPMATYCERRVYVCPVTNDFHACTAQLCQRAHKHRGERVCTLTGRVLDTAMAYEWSDRPSGGGAAWGDYGGENDDRPATAYGSLGPLRAAGRCSRSGARPPAPAVRDVATAVVGEALRLGAPGEYTPDELGRLEAYYVLQVGDLYAALGGRVDVPALSLAVVVGSKLGWTLGDGTQGGDNPRLRRRFRDMSVVERVLQPHARRKGGVSVGVGVGAGGRAGPGSAPKRLVGLRRRVTALQSDIKAAVVRDRAAMAVLAADTVLATAAADMPQVYADAKR